MQKISRQRSVEGTRIPGIIKNGQYFYVNVDVYEDGMVNCWELVDLKGLEEKIRINWLLPQIPNGENISIFHLGCFKILDANWEFDKKSYFKHINKIIKELNPKLANIYTISKEEKELLKMRRIKYSPSAKDFYVKNELGYRTIEGEGFTVFFKHKGKNYLVNLVVYKDENVVCYNTDIQISFKIDEIKKLFEDGTFFTNFNEPTRIIFNSLGELVLSNELVYAVSIEEKYKELQDIYNKLNGNVSSLEKCRNAYFQYLEYPSEESRAHLKKLYELIPEHERIYLGDMDTMDTDYIRIIYHPESKREV